MKFRAERYYVSYPVPRDPVRKYLTQALIMFADRLDNYVSVFNTARREVLKTVPCRKTR